MKPFAYHEPDDAAEAVRLLETHGGEGRLIAGGSDLLGELKDGIVHYGQLISLSRVEGLDQIHREDSGLRLGAMVILARMEEHPLLSGPYRMLAEAARGVATPEIRNQGTLGGNLCQRPRCLHYRSMWVSCLKKGDSGCPAMESPHQSYLSVMGAGDCRAVNPSDLAPPLVALAATAIIEGSAGTRKMPLADFFAGPDQIAGRDNALEPGELLVAVAFQRVGRMTPAHAAGHVMAPNVVRGGCRIAGADRRATGTTSRGGPGASRILRSVRRGLRGQAGCCASVVRTRGGGTCRAVSVRFRQRRRVAW